MNAIPLYAINQNGGLVEMPFNWPGFSPSRFNLDTSPEAVDAFFEKLDYIGKCAATYGAHNARKAAERRGTFDFEKDAFYPRETHTKAWVEKNAPWDITPQERKERKEPIQEDTNTPWEDMYY